MSDTIGELQEQIYYRLVAERQEIFEMLLEAQLKNLESQALIRWAELDIDSEEFKVKFEQLSNEQAQSWKDWYENELRCEALSAAEREIEKRRD